MRVKIRIIYLTSSQLKQEQAPVVQKVDPDVDCKTVRIFVYSSTREQSNKRFGTRLKTHTPLFTDFFTDFEKKTDCFVVLSWTYPSDKSLSTG